MLASFFTNKLSKLEQIVASIELDVFIADELLAVDFNEHLLTADENIVFAVLTEDDAAIYWSLIEVAESQTFITEEITYCTVDDLDLVLCNASTNLFIFIKVKHIAQADDLITSLL